MAGGRNWGKGVVVAMEGGVDVDDIEGGRARRREKWERYSCVWM